MQSSAQNIDEFLIPLAGIFFTLLVFVALGAIVLNQVRVMLGRVLRSVGLLLLSVFANLYLWFLDRLYLRAGAFPREDSVAGKE